MKQAYRQLVTCISLPQKCNYFWYISSAPFNQGTTGGILMKQSAALPTSLPD